MNQDKKSPMRIISLDEKRRIAKRQETPTEQRERNLAEELEDMRREVRELRKSFLKLLRILKTHKN